jgi:hypothetical protein
MSYFSGTLPQIRHFKIGSSMMRQLFLIATLFLISGCMGLPKSLDQGPGIDDFPKQELIYRVSGDVVKAVESIQSSLTRRKVPSTPPMIRAPSVFVVSAYVVEPKGNSDRRVRRTAFLFTVAPIAQGSAGGPACSTVAVASLTQSRGTFEERWSVQEEDKGFESLAWPVIYQEITAKECK